MLPRFGIGRCAAAVFAVAWLLALAGPAGAQAPPSAPAPAAGELPVSIDRIREALARTPETRITMPRPPDFFVEVDGRLPRVEDFITNESLRSTAALPAAVTHGEFLSMVTPAEARSFGSFSPSELAVVAATSLGFAYAASTLPGLVRQAWRDRQSERARKEVQAVLAELERNNRTRADADPPPTGTPAPPPP
jgi:hypothetical protein